MNEEFDYIVVGAGSSGAVIANRLSARPDINVCLVEAGPKDNNPLIPIPLGMILLAKNPRLNWLFASDSHAGLNGRAITVPRGKTLGGSSAINGMIYIRGSAADYDKWAADGCDGWAYEDVLPYFKKSEANTDFSLDEAYHGRDGLLCVTDLKNPNPLDHSFVEAAGELQYRPCNDFNTPKPEGAGIYQVTQKNGKRHSTSAAFLNPIRNRKNLKIITGAEVARVEFAGQCAKGIRLAGNTNDKAIRARHEIVLSAGAIGSPDILMRSGIGDARTARTLGVELVHENKKVGQNLHDHVDIMIVNSSKSRISHGLSFGALPRLALDSLRWIFFNSGLLSSNMVEAGAFIKSSPEIELPDLQLTFIPGKKSVRGRMIEWGHGVSLHTCILRPFSRGAVTRSKPGGAPHIDLGLLSDDRDAKLLAKAARIARNVLSQKAFSSHGLKEIHPGSSVQTEEEFEEFARNNAKTIYHPVGTCAMGKGGNAVVDSRLKVIGVDGLRVADASIMPSITGGNTNAPCIMIGEKAADMILRDMR